MAYVTESFTDYQYSTRCYLDKILHADGSVTEYAYDCDGNLAKTWDANHPSASQTNPPTTEYTYDELDRLTTVTQPWAGAGGGTAVTSYGYDVQDHLTDVTDAEGNLTSYTYSDRDLLTEEISIASGTTTHAYNDHGELTSSTDARGITTTRVIDALDRVTAMSYPDSSLDVTYSHDTAPAACASGEDFANGRLASISRHGGSVDYCYDRFARLTRDGTLTYTYDENGNKETIGYPGGVIARYSHDFADRQATLTAEISGEPDHPLVTAASYRPAGPLSSLALGNGVTEDRAFTSRYFPDRITATGAGTLLDWDYTTDSVGNPTAIADLLTPANDRTYAYQDYHYFLTQGDGPWGALSWSYDQIGNRLTETRDAVTDTYTYHPGTSGNTPLLAQVQLGAGGTRTYTFGPAGHQTQVDAAGNLIDFAYADDGRLARIERTAATASVDFQYDGRSFLQAGTAEVLTILSTDKGPSTDKGAGTPIFADDFETGDVCQWDQYFNAPLAACPKLVQLDLTATYDSAGLLHARSNQSGDSTLFYFAGRPVALLDDGSTFLYLTTDHLGTPILATDASETEVWQGGFEPFGEDYSGAQAAGVYLRFLGQWDDVTWQEAGLGAGVYYNVHRWDEGGAGRYARADPAGLVRSNLDLYGYGLKNPTRFVDPFGLTTCVIISADTLFEFGDSLVALGDHSALLIDGPCQASPSCGSSPGPALYDPAGGYSLQFPGAGTAQILSREVPGWSTEGFFDYHCNSGSDFLEVYCFNTTCCQERKIRSQASPAGSFGCAAGVGDALRGVGPFSDLSGTSTPAILRRAMNRLLQRHSGAGASTFTHTCPRSADR